MTLQIFEQLEPPAPFGNRFRILEVYDSCDGPRTRVTDRSFPTFEAAQDFVNPNRPKPAHRLEEEDDG